MTMVELLGRHYTVLKIIPEYLRKKILLIYLFFIRKLSFDHMNFNST